jgi:hypothetical protein
MPAFNRGAIDSLLRRRAQMHALANGSTVASPFASPLQGCAAFSTEGRPATAAHNTARHMPLSNPRSPASLHLLDCLIEPQVRSRLEQQDSVSGRPLGVTSDGSESPQETIKAVQDADHGVRDSSEDIVNLGASYRHSDTGNTGPMAVALNRPVPFTQDIRSRCEASEAGLDATGQAEEGNAPEPQLNAKGRAGDALPEATKKADAVEELMAEVRTARYAGNLGEGSDQLRLARLEIKLKALKVRCFLRKE